MLNYEEFFRLPLWEELTCGIKHEVIQIQRPPEQVILDDADLCKMLKISKRTSAYLRANNEITYYKCGRVLYKLSDVHAYVDANKVEAIDCRLKSRFK